MFDLTKFINPSQVGGIEAYTIDEGPARGVRALCVNTGAGLRYRVLGDRGLDIDQAFYADASLAFLSHKGVTAPTRGLDRGLDWLKSFAVGLLTSCGPFNIGSPCTDNGEELGLHGPHSNTAATIESIIQPDPHAGKMDMSITGVIRYGALYGPCVTLRRTITSTLGQNTIAITDEFHNAGNTPAPHAWLLHINFGYPLVDEGSEICCNATKVEGHPDSPEAQAFYSSPRYKRLTGPKANRVGEASVVGYFWPKPLDRAGNTTVGIINRRLNMGVAIRYNTKQFARCVNWQHLGPREYVTALEPSTGSVEGRDKDRARGLLEFLEPDQRKTYQYAIEVVTEKEGISKLRALNG